MMRSFLDILGSQGVVYPGHVGAVAGVSVLLDTVIDGAHGLSLLGHGGQKFVCVR